MDNKFRLFSFAGVKSTSAVRYHVKLTVQSKYLITHRAVGKLLNKLKEISSFSTSVSVGFATVTAVVVKSSVCWYITSFIPLKGNLTFKGVCHL